MKVTVLPARQLTPDLIDTWSRLQQSCPALDSPYFRPEFTQAVAAVRSDVEVGILEESGRIVGFFPFQRSPSRIGRPVGGPMNDIQGVVGQCGAGWSAEDLVRGCGLRAYDFDNLVASQAPFRPHGARMAVSGYMDLSRGFESYHAERRRAGSDSIKKTLQKARKFEREVAPLRFEAHTTEREVFRTLLKWKTAQYEHTRVPNVFAFDWTAALLEHVLTQKGEGFRPLLAALYAGDQLIAVELGIRSYGVLHRWFPAYNKAFAAYSPGLILLMEMARAAEGLGLRRFDLGKGMVQSKVCFMSGTVEVAEGSVALTPVTSAFRWGWQRLRACARGTPLRKPALLVQRLMRPLHTWLVYH